MEKRGWYILGGILLVFVVIIFIVYFIPYKESFGIKPSTLKINLIVGEEATSSIRIINREFSSQNFKVSFNPLFQEMASLEKSEFTLNSKERERLNLYFKDINNVSEVYSGKLIIEGYGSFKELPIILNVETSQPAKPIEGESSKYDFNLFKNVGFLILILIVFLGAILFLYFYFSRTKDKLLAQLREEHENELKEHDKKFVLSEQAPKNLKSEALRIIRLQKLEEGRKKAFRRIKDKQVKEMAEFKRLKGKGRGKSNKELKEKIEAWGRKRAIEGSLEKIGSKTKK